MTRPLLPDRHQLLRRAVEIYGPNPPDTEFPELIDDVLALLGPI